MFHKIAGKDIYLLAGRNYLAQTGYTYIALIRHGS